eukprot:259371-Alexandrium_andersonii.AAC.1
MVGGGSALCTALPNEREPPMPTQHSSNRDAKGQQLRVVRHAHAESREPTPKGARAAHPYPHN